jgi:hypothetical protein
MATFGDVLAAENEELRDVPLVSTEGMPMPEKTVGLAFSGGGIRSATFNLGILQGLASHNVLNKIDYLSTVSGGGYIGAWLISWIKRAPGGLKEVQDQLGDYEHHRKPGGPIAEPRQVNFLRDYTNYLTPRMGIFGADTWAAIATYVRNALLNQIILVAFLGAIVLVPWCVLRTSQWVSGNNPWIHAGFQGAAWIVTLAGALLVLGVCWASRQTALCSLTAKEAPASAAGEYVMLLSVLPLFLSAILTVMALWLGPASHIATWAWYRWALAGAVSYGGAHVAGVFCRWIAIKAANQPDGHLTRNQWIFIPLTAAGSGALGGLVVEVFYKLILLWRGWEHGFPHAMTWGPALMVAIFLLIGTLHIGFLKVLIQNEEQEWWGRTGGLLLLVSIAWTALFVLTVFVPWCFGVWGGWVKTKVALVLGWALSTAFGVLSGKSPKTSGKSNGSPVMEVAALAAPYIFVMGLLVLLSWGGFCLARTKLIKETVQPGEMVIAATSAPVKNVSVAVDLKAVGANSMSPESGAGSGVTIAGKLTMLPGQPTSIAEKSKAFWQVVHRLPASWLWINFAWLLLVAFLVALRVDINIFSMNLLYRNRLVRCYLGASRLNDRHPNTFTGFDPADEFSMAVFRKEDGYDGPYPIVCGALNVTHGERLAWQERKAESFVFTPRFCGYEFSEMHTVATAKEPGGFRETEEYAYPRNKQDPSHAKVGGVHLGTAISISGAAASPNMGYHTSPPLAFLMTVFNVRLGWWLANPRYANDELWIRPEGGPPCSLFYLLKELFASTTDRSDYVYLSDGGHFENLAIYELVRRRCEYIIACDADADDGMKFGDLGNAIRKCRSDFGVEIAVDTVPLKPDEKTTLAEAHGVVGTIQYPTGPNGEPAFQGHLLYIKPTITKDVPRDVLAYRDSHDAFPDEPTADQWFDESQFESYRKLGLYSFKSLSSGGKRDDIALDVQAFFAGISR